MIFSIKLPLQKFFDIIKMNLLNRLKNNLANYDLISYLNCEIITIALKSSSAIATLLLASGSKGKRYAFKNSEIRMSLIIDKVIDCYVKTTGLDKKS